MRAGLLAAVLLAGCAHERAPGWPSERKAARLQVPFFPDDTDQCGPSALASVMSYWGDATEPDGLRKEIYTAKLGGSLPMDLMLAARAHGLSASMSEGGAYELRREIDAGRPAIAFLNLGFKLVPIGHFVVVTGYDARGVYAHSGERRDVHRTWREFESQWAKTGRWMLRVSRPS
ncbi:MAG: C39 family peptidase [Elusimicrobiota bacterium]|nr:MAG: C39 family peptidase [Elusimicrobiota bacterium]